METTTSTSQRWSGFVGAELVDTAIHSRREGVSNLGKQDNEGASICGRQGSEDLVHRLEPYDGREFSRLLTGRSERDDARTSVIRALFASHQAVARESVDGVGDRSGRETQQVGQGGLVHRTALTQVHQNLGP